tara:strand:+ start:132 stop:377 length:246 start_codon:yes stop_codon:yes gene_type:complete
MDYNKNYTIKELEKIVENGNVSLLHILKTQKLTLSFCNKYLLDETNKYCVTEMDENILLGDVLYYQNHLKREDFIAINNKQ